MAPEVLHGFNESTPKIDIWSLGVILHGLILGYLPFGGANNEEIKKQIKEKEINSQKEEDLKFQKEVGTCL